MLVNWSLHCLDGLVQSVNLSNESKVEKVSKIGFIFFFVGHGHDLIGSSTGSGCLCRSFFIFKIIMLPHFSTRNYRLIFSPLGLVNCGSLLIIIIIRKGNRIATASLSPSTQLSQDITISCTLIQLVIRLVWAAVKTMYTGFISSNLMEPVVTIWFC